MANTRVNIDVNINTSDAARNLRQLQAQINSFQSALNTNNRLQGDASRFYSQQLKDLANQSGMFSAETVKMRTAASQLDQTLSKGQGTMRQFVSARFLKDSAEAAQVLSLANSRASALQTQFVATGAAANGFREAVAIRPLQAFNSETAISAQKLAIHRAMLSQSTTSMINFGKNTQWAGRQLMVGFTVPLTIFAATAGKVFREIETEAINFRKVYGDAFTPPEEMEANLEAIKGLAKEYTKYGIAVKDTIGLAAQAAAAGSQGADLIDATTEATRLATLGQMDQNQALETTIALQTAFGLKSKDLTKTINFLNMVENQTVVTLQDLAEAIPRVAPVIKGLGGSVEDMAAMLAAMQEGGVSAAQGANALKSGLASLINPTNRAVEKLGELGININAIVDANRGDLMATVQGFARALSTLDEFGKQQALEKVFGKYQYARLGALFNNIIKDGSQASRVMDTAALSAAQLAASATKELGAIEDSSATKFVAAMERLKLAIAPIGQMFTELATPVLGFLGSLVEKFNSLPDFAKKFIGFGTVITGIIIPAGTMFLGLLMNLAGTLTKFGLVVGVAFKGFTQGGLRGSVQAVSQALNFMSLAELDAANASSQLGTSTGIVNQALRDQVPAAAGADAAIDSLSRSYAALIVQMSEAAQLSRVAFVAPGAAMAGAAATGAEAGKRTGGPRIRGGPRLRRNFGGTIPGSGNTDTVPAMLTPGEFVVNKQATGENLALLHAINKGREVPGFNKGGQIPGMQYFGGRSPGGNVKQMDDAWKADQATFARMFGIGGNRRTQASNTASLRGSENIYNSLTGNYERGQNVRVDTLRYAVEKLGFNPQQLGLKTRGNLTFRMSKDSNLAMMRGDLSRENLLKELETPDVYSPLARQLDSYLGARLDTNAFDRMYREEIGKLPLTGINNGRFEKASRNAVRRYLDSAGFPKARRNSFIRDVLQGDTVNANMSLPAIKQALDARGIEYTSGQSKKDLYVDMNGRQVNIGNLAGRESGNLGRPQGILDYAGLRGSGEAVHANKGGMIPGMQYLNDGNIAQLIRNIASSRNRIGGVSLQRTTSKGVLASSPRRIYDEEGVDYQRWRSGKKGKGYKDLLERGYITQKEYDDMVGSGRYAVHGVSNEFTASMNKMGASETIGSSPTIKLKDLLEKPENKNLQYDRNMADRMGDRTAKIKPSSLVSATPQFNTQLGTDSATLDSLGPIGGQHMIGLAEQLMRRGVDKTLARRILNKAARELRKQVAQAEVEAKKQGRKGIGEAEFSDAISAAEETALINYSDSLILANITANKGGTIPMLNGGGIAAAANAARGARGRIPANIVEWFSRMTTSISQSNRDDMLQNIPANIRRGLSTARRRIDITRGSVDPIDGGTLKEVSSWSTGQGVGRFMESSRLFDTMNNSKFQIAQTSGRMKRDLDSLKSLGPDGPRNSWSQFHQANGGLSLRLTPEEIQESGGVIWKANKKKLEERIKQDQEFIAGHQKIIDDLQESNIPTIYRTSVKKGEKYFDVSDRIVPREDQRIDNPAASNAILEEKEVALLGARLTGRPKTRIVEREEAQARYDKAKEEIKRIRMAIFNKETSAEKAKPDLDRLHDETENMAAFVNWGRGREVTYPNVVSRNMGGMIPGIQQLMAGARVQPYVRPKKPAGPRVTELEKEVMRRRAELSVAKDQDLNDLIFRRNQDGKLDLAPEELLVLLRSNPNVSDKQLKEIAKYHSSRIKKGMFGHFDRERGYKTVDRSAGTWRSISQVLDERGYPVVQKRNMGGLIPQTQYFATPNPQRVVQSAEQMALFGPHTPLPTAYTDVIKSKFKKILKYVRPASKNTNGLEVIDYIIETLTGGEALVRTMRKPRRPQVTFRPGQDTPDFTFDQETGQGALFGAGAPFVNNLDSIFTTEPGLVTEFIKMLVARNGKPLTMNTAELSPQGFKWREKARELGLVTVNDKGVAPTKPTTGPIEDSLVDKARFLHSKEMLNTVPTLFRNTGGQIFDSTKTSRTIVPGVGNKDTVPAALTPGEFVINKDATRKNLDLLRAVNNGTIRGYQTGAQVIGFDENGNEIKNPKTARRRVRDGLPIYENISDGQNGKAPMDDTKVLDRADRAATRTRRTRTPIPPPTPPGEPRGRRGMGMGASMAMGTVGGAMMMAPMIPGIGENATLSAVASGGGMALSLASALPMLAPMLAPLAAIAVPAGIVAASLAVVGVALYAWRKTVDDAAVKAAEFGANIGGTANALNTMAQILGTQTPAQARQKAVMGISSEEEATIANEFSGVFESGAGQKFIEDLQNSTSAERFQKLSDYLKSAIASGMMDQKAATTFAKAVGLKLGDSVLSNQAVSSISGQKTGTSAMKEIADMRKQAVEASGSLAELNASTGEASLSNEAAGRAIGAAGQIIEDYGNVIGVAQQQYAEGTIGWEEYHTAITEARLAQEKYTDVIKKSVTNAAEQGAARQALDQQLIASGLTEDQVGAITNSTDIGMSSLGFSESKDYLKPVLSALSGNLPGMFAGMIDIVTASQTAYQKEFVKQQADVQFGKSFDELDSTQQTSLLEQSKETQDLAREVDLEGLNEAIKLSVRAGDMTADQAAQFGQSVMNSSEALLALKGGASIATTQFIMLADSIPGLSDAQKQNVKELGVGFENIGGDVNQFSNYIATLPEGRVRDLGIKNFEQAAIGTDSKRRGRGASLSADERLRRQTDQITGLQSLSGSIGVGDATVLQSKDAYKQALAQEGISANIDKAFSTATESGVAQRVIKYVIQTEGENTPQEMISSITKLTVAQRDIMSLPDEMIKGLKIDTTDPEDLLKFGAAAKTLKDQWKIIENLNPNINLTAAMEFLTLDAEGNPLTPEQVSKNVIKLNKAMKDLESGNPEIRKRAMIDIAVAYSGKNIAGGNPQKAAANAISGLREQFKNFDKLDPVVQEQMIEIRMAYEVKNLQLVMQLNSAMAALKTATDAESRQIILQRIASLQGQIATAEALVETNLAPIPGSGSSSGGGGGGEKSIEQQLKEQAKLSGETFKGISNLQNEKGFKSFIAGPFAPEFLEYLRSQGKAGLKLINGGIEKVKAAYANFQKSKISDGAAMAALTPQALIEESQKVALSSQYNRKLAEQGMYADDIDAVRQLVSDEDLLAKKILERKLKNKTITDSERKQLGKYRREQAAAERDAPIINQAQKISGSITDMTTETALLNEEIAFINEGRTPELAAAMAAAGLKAGDATGRIELFTDAYNKLKAAQYAKDPGKLDQDIRDNAAEIRDIQRQIEEINLIRPLEDQVEVQQKIIDGQEKIVRVKQQEIDAIGRTIELKQRELEPLDDQIEKLQELSDKTSEAYDAQIEALDEVYRREENIAKLKQGQLDVAQALSRGDVAAAAQGALGMSQELARQSREEARSALESQKELATQNIQNKILEIEKQKKKINQDIEDLQMRQRAIQDEIYTIQSTKILPAENEIYRLQGLINVEADKLKDKYKNAADEMASLVRLLDQAIAREKDLKGIKSGDSSGGSAAPATAPNPAIYNTNERGGVTQAAVDMVRAETGSQLSDQAIADHITADPHSTDIHGLSTLVAPAATTPIKIPNPFGLDFSKKPKKMYGGKISKYLMGGIVGYKGSTERAPGMMYGGSAKKYAYGSTVPGKGMTDKVPALLTPGEFVVRKRVAEQYGPLLELLNGQVFPTMKTNSFNSSSKTEKSGSMYNYNVNVTLNGSDMDANDVANAVIQKIKMTENKGIRSNNIRG